MTSANSAPQAVDIKSIINLVSNEMTTVNTILSNNLDSDVTLIKQLGAYIVQAGGKRLRPVSLLLAAKACSRDSNTTQENAPLLAAIVEFIHTATLLHDDVVDESEMRRGRETANEVFGNAASVLVGDFLYSRAFQMMIKADSMRVMEILSHTTNQIAEGEVMQLINCGSAETTEQQYMDTIQSKTAILFEASTQLGAVVSKQPLEVEHALAKYGLHLGTAFQLVDDILDYTADAKAMGKNVGDDLAEGKPTLPLIHAIEKSTGTDKELLIKAITNADRENLSEVLGVIQKTQSIEYTAKIAQQQIMEAKRALSILKESSYKTALIELAKFSIERTF